MNYQETMEFVQHANKFGSVLGLQNIRILLERLGNPQDDLKIVHVAGTNGKGSILAYLSSVFRESGYRGGRYISPAPFAYEERFQINNEYITKERLCFFMEKVKKECENMVLDGLEHPTIFEIETAVSLLYFLDEKVDVVFLETGMGGRLDATNVIKKPICCVIASIGMDHMQYLGNTIEEIAGEKAGIIKENVPVISYCNSPAAISVIQKKAEEKKAPLTVVDKNMIRVLDETLMGQSFSYRTAKRRYEKIEIPLLGEHQIYNGATALEVLEVVKDYFCLGDFQVEEGFRKTKWAGRLEMLDTKPYVFCDGAHNPDGAEALLHFLQKNFTNKKITYIIGVLADKDYQKMVELTAPMASAIYTVTPDNDRALDSELLAKEARKHCSQVTAMSTLHETYKTVKEQCKEDEVLVVFGTLSFLHEIYEDR